MPAGAGGIEHQGADRVVAAQVPPDLLQDQIGRLGTQHRPRTTLMGLELVEGVLDLPSLRVGEGEICSAGLLRVEDRGQQPVLLGVVPAVVEV